jgi:hypothetical protein
MGQFLRRGVIVVVEQAGKLGEPVAVALKIGGINHICIYIGTIINVRMENKLNTSLLFNSLSINAAWGPVCQFQK